jgi:hypothetical protein
VERKLVVWVEGIGRAIVTVRYEGNYRLEAADLEEIFRRCVRQAEGYPEEGERHAQR